MHRCAAAAGAARRPPPLLLPSPPLLRPRVARCRAPSQRRAAAAAAGRGSWARAGAGAAAVAAAIWLWRRRRGVKATAASEAELRESLQKSIKDELAARQSVREIKRRLDALGTKMDTAEALSAQEKAQRLLLDDALMQCQDRQQEIEWEQGVHNSRMKAHQRSFDELKQKAEEEVEGAQEALQRLQKHLSTAQLHGGARADFVDTDRGAVTFCGARHKGEVFCIIAGQDAVPLSQHAGMMTWEPRARTLRVPGVGSIALSDDALPSLPTLRTVLDSSDMKHAV